jgi:alpha-glucosidase (family GH31 glycosyl hydrolase)
MRLILLMVFIAPVRSQPVWEKGAFKIFIRNNIIDLYHDQDKFIEIRSFKFNFIQPDSLIMERVRNDTIFLKLLFTKSDGFHSGFPAQISLTISQFENTFHFYASHPVFNHITITMKNLQEHYFGLIEKLYPDNEKLLDLRGNTVDIDVYGNGEQDFAENYASAYSAFYMSNLGYGSFFDTFAKGRYQLAVNGLTEIYHQTGTLDWYLFYGPGGDVIHQQYFKIIGKPKYVPIWACGPIFWRDQNNGGKDEILDDIQKFTEHHIPLTACFVDRPYSNGANEWSKMDFNLKFTDPGSWIKTIHQKYGLELMSWVGPLTFGDKDFPGLLTDDRGYIDLTNPEAVNEFERRLSKNQYAVGVRGHKMDRADENFPVTAKWHDPVPVAEVRNKYIFLYSKVIHNFLSKAYGRNQFNFARSAFHRCQPFLSALWGGDSRANWQGMAGNQVNALRCSFQGFPVWGSDTGGYLGEGKIDEDLYIRWLQWSAWAGLFEVKIDGAGGSGEDRPPWKYPQRLQDVYRKVCEQRMELLPYIYSCANTSFKNGVLMKPLTYIMPGDEHTFPIWDEYIFGGAFLVAPVFSKDSCRQIYLPQGRWYDFNDIKTEYRGPVTITRNVPLDSIPVFIKENSIYVSGNIYQGNSKLWTNDRDSSALITIHLFPGRVNDTTAFDYIDYLDHDTEKTMTLTHRPDKLIFLSSPLTTGAIIDIRCERKPQQIALNNKSVRYKYDKVEKIAVIKMAKNKSINLEIIK